MKSSSVYTKLSLFMLLYAIFLTGSRALAHDGFSSPIIEGHGMDMNLNIVHGCDTKPIIAQSLLFPTMNPVLTAFNSSFKPVKPPADLGAVIEGGTLQSLINLIQDHNVFEVLRHKRNALTNIIGYYGKNGKLASDLQGRIPFQIVSPFFLAESCAKQLYIQVAIADICNLEKPTIQAGKLNLFIPDNGSQYAILGSAAGVHGVGEPSTLIVRRNLQTKPLPSACGKGITVVATPSAEDIDANLGFPGWHY